MWDSISGELLKDKQCPICKSDRVHLIRVTEDADEPYWKQKIYLKCGHCRNTSESWTRHRGWKRKLGKRWNHEEVHKKYTPCFKTKKGIMFNAYPLDTMEEALAKYEEWARDYHISSAWVEVRDTDNPWYYRKYKVKLVGVLKKEVDE